MPAPGSSNVRVYEDARQQFLKRELAAIDYAYRQSRADPKHCDTVLSFQRNHVKHLFLRGEINEVERLILLERIADHTKAVRLTILETQRISSPRTLKRIEQILHDGHLTSWEFQRLLATIEEDSDVAADQKALIRELLRDWYKRDHTAEWNQA